MNIPEFKNIMRIARSAQDLSMILTAKALLDKNPKPSAAEIKEAISGNLCRCTGYTKIVKAIGKAAQELA